MNVVLCVLALACLSSVSASLSRSEWVEVAGELREWQSMGRWSESGRVEEEESIAMYIALKRANAELLERKFWSVSDPKNADYGQYWSREEVDRLTAPSDAALDAIAAWLAQSPVPLSVRIQSDWMVVEGPMYVMKGLLGGQVHFRRFSDGRGNSAVRTMDRLRVPSSVAEHIDFIGGLQELPKSFEFATEAQIQRDHIREMKRDMAHEESDFDPVILYMLPGDTTMSCFFQPICPGGNYTTDPDRPCSESGYVLSQVNQHVEQLSHPKDYNRGLTDTVCKPCNQWTSRQASNCQTQNTNYGYPDNTVYCNAPVWNNLKNFYPIQYSLQTAFSHENSSNILYSNIVPYTARPLYLGIFATPDVLLSRYGVAQGQEIASALNNSQSVAEFSAQYYNQTELDYFFQQLNVVPGPVKVVGRNIQHFPGQEATLDIQYMMGVSQNVTTYFWTEGYTFLTWIIDVLNSGNAPLVNSVSYASTESTYTSEFLERINSEFQEAGNVGVSLLFAAGDWGVSFPDEPSCTSLEHFSPLFPASSPYITSVGGTQFSTVITPACTDTIIGVPFTCDKTGEITCSIETGSRITTGGGFSDAFTMPSYQTDVVNYYLNTFVKDNIPSNYYNSTNRAYPDVAACARNYPVFVSGAWNPVDGTSAATPVFAAMLALANDERLLKGQPPVGFVNQMLYQNMFEGGRYTPQYYDTFWDIEIGENKCGELGMTCCPYGFYAALGWDAVTGLGTPKDLLTYLRM